MLNSSVKSIAEHDVEIESDGQIQRCRNDVVIVCAGGLLTIPLLQNFGIWFDTKFGTA